MGFFWGKGRAKEITLHLTHLSKVYFISNMIKVFNEFRYAIFYSLMVVGEVAEYRRSQLQKKHKKNKLFLNFKKKYSFQTFY